MKYDIPKLPQHLALIGDIHSHPAFSPTPSYTDKDDEVNRPGLHIIAGYVDGKFHPIEFHCVAVLDGERFVIEDHSVIMEPYVSSDTADVPDEWMDKVKPDFEPWSGGSSHYGEYGGSTGGYQYQTTRGPGKHDKEIISKILSTFAKRDICPTNYEVRQALFTATKIAGYTWCEQKAEKFIKNWERKHEEVNAE